jgi:hypothetical protein
MCVARRTMSCMPICISCSGTPGRPPST